MLACAYFLPLQLALASFITPVELSPRTISHCTLFWCHFFFNSSSTTCFAGFCVVIWLTTHCVHSVVSVNKAIEFPIKIQIHAQIFVEIQCHWFMKFYLDFILCWVFCWKKNQDYIVLEWRGGQDSITLVWIHGSFNSGSNSWQN